MAELLIVVAMALIIGAVAAGNWQAALQQSHVARAKADLRELGVALEAYVVDWDASPPDGDDYLPQGAGRGNPSYELNRASDILPPCPAGSLPNSGPNNRIYFFRTYKTWTYLTTPVAYIDTIRIEPFSSFIPYSRQGPSSGERDPGFMLLTSCGPDRTILSSRPTTEFSGGDSTSLSVPAPDSPAYPVSIRVLNNLYDPTNGTLSWGEIYRFSAIKRRSAIGNTYGSLIPGDFTP